MRFLLANGETLDSLGPNFNLDGAAFHGHWELCRFLIENGADPNCADPDTGETPLHAALCKANRPGSCVMAASRFTLTTSRLTTMAGAG